MVRRSNALTTWRLYVILFLLLLGCSAVVVRLAFLQIGNHGFYKALAQGQQNIQMLAQGERGAVFVQDKNGALYTLASNQEVPLAFLSPTEVTNQEETITRAAEVLKLEEAFLTSRLQNQNSQFELLKRQLSQKEVEHLFALKLPGVYVTHERVRTYPYSSLAAHVVGFVNQDGNGQYGIEERYQDVLEGKEGVKAGSKNPSTYLLSMFGGRSEDGQDLILTLDYNIQAIAESLLQKAETELNVQGGTIIVMDPSSGKLRALANTPTFDPNLYAKVQDIAVFQNPTIQKIYEPGSVFKAITMASALDAEAITPQTTYEDLGILKIAGRTITNYDQRTWGQRTMAEVLEYSINTGAVFAENKLGHDKFLEYIDKFGFFKPTHVELAGEIFSRNTEFKKGYEINFATASFGQGIEITSMQLVQAFSALANDGIMLQPSIIEEQKQHKQGIRVIGTRAAHQITEMLASVVQNGFGKAAQIPGYHIAGKTGTAQVPWSALGIRKSGYSDKTVQSFIGYGPAFNPAFLILVKLDNPATKTAEYSAIPIFRELAKYIIDYYQIPPDY